MTDHEEALSRYYNIRASEYEAIYRREDPERQAELAAIADEMREWFAGRRVLEVACGTGYWTEIIAPVAAHIVATDLSPEMLAMAAHKGLDPARVEFRRADAWMLESVHGEFDAGLANFWLSHVPRRRIDEFLDLFHGRLVAGARVFLVDNVYVPGVGGELVTRTGGPDTFKRRMLANGSTHEVLKNYYSKEELERLFTGRAKNLNIHMGTNYWWMRYTIE
jgi:ubiquinone/menaquinone biosynthesis C-methylase UbiE